MTNYIPKGQPKRWQLLDSLFILLWVHVYSYIRLILESDLKSVREIPVVQSHSSESQGVYAVEQERWLELGHPEQYAVEIINDKFDYTTSPQMLIFTALVSISYFFSVLRGSKAQQRELIAENSGEPPLGIQQ